MQRAGCPPFAQPSPPDGDGAPSTQTGPLAGLRVGYLGHFDPGYARNRILSKALRRAGAGVVTLIDRRCFALRTPALLREALRTPVDLLLVGFPGHLDVGTARLAVALRRDRVPVISDPLISMFESAEDRRGHPPGGFGSMHLRLDDWVALHLADLILVDTKAHGRYYADKFGVCGEVFRQVWVGADDDLLRPVERPPSDEFVVFFYGNFNPLQGVEHIVRAAQLLERVGERMTFRIVGQGQTYGEVRRLTDRLGVRTIEFWPGRPYDELGRIMATSDVCLGIFGTSGQGQRVVPNKVFDALAMARPVVTGDTPAAREALDHGADAWLCPTGSPEALAHALGTLRHDPDLRDRLARAGHERFSSTYSLAAISRRIVEVVLEAVGGRGHG
jgi:glycosyltransferase involved in cell wall biosynthesis